MADLAFAPTAQAAAAVIACGNPTRTDDGVAAEVLRRLRASGLGPEPSRIKLLDAGIEGIAVVFGARGCRRLIIIDACRGDAPGAVHEMSGDELTRGPSRPLATHDFRWEDAIAAGRRIFGAEFPEEVSVFLIGTQSLDFGLGLTPIVWAAAAKVADRIASLLREVPALEVTA